MQNRQKFKLYQGSQAGAGFFGKPFASKRQSSPPADESAFVEPVRDSDNDPFLNSLENLTPDDIAPSPVKRKKTVGEIINSSLRTVLTVVCAGIFVVSGASVVNSLYNYQRGDDIYAGMQDDFYSADEGTEVKTGAVSYVSQSPKSTATPDFATALTLSSDHSLANETVSTESYNAEFERVKASLSHLAIKYPDLYGWITIENTNIDYPIVQYTDNDYYLDHAANGDYLPAGSIFTDYRCSSSILKNHNTVLYGHNMVNGLMFNHVTKYLDENFFNDNPYITISTPDGIFTYLIFAIYQTDMYSSYITTDFYSHEAFVEFAYEMKAKSLYEREGVEFTTTDRILTLSTCTNGYFADRYCLQALLVDISN